MNMDLESNPNRPMEHSTSLDKAGESHASGLSVWMEHIPGATPTTRFIRRHQNILWWMHSAYALLLGIAVMLVASKSFRFLHIVMLQIAFIWVASLFLPALVNHHRIHPPWGNRLRLAGNYIMKNFYQQMLFLLLPIYFSSSTFSSRNMLFVCLLAVSATLSTMDVLFDQYLTVRWYLSAVFLSFNLFATINVMLPVLLRVSNYWALWISGALALVSMASMVYRFTSWSGRKAWRLLGIGAAGLFLLIFFFRSFIPPAPLHLASTEFGASVKSLQIVAPLTALPPDYLGKVAALTRIKAPNGLQERVRQKWYQDGKLIYAQEPIRLIGGREEGFRLWSAVSYDKKMQGKSLRLDVETESGQLIGRARISAAH
jgi:hypothetical protein